MTALGILVVTAAYGLLCFWLTKLLLRRIKSEWLKWTLGIILFPLLYVAPLADEIIGNYQFKKYCKEAEEIKIYGTITVGEELYFEDGRWRLSQATAFTPGNEIQRIDRVITSLLEHKESQVRLKPATIPIEEKEVTIFARQTGKKLAAYRWYATSGGWLSRNHGMESPYIVKPQCFPPSVGAKLDTQILIFDKNLGGSR
jgi:hypothetical protein